MSVYIPQGFEPGQILKADQLNYIEEGITKILPIIEAGEAKQLVTDAEGNLLWEKKILDYTVEDMLLFSEIQMSSGVMSEIDQSCGPFIAAEIGDSATVIFDGIEYRSVVQEDPRGYRITIDVNSNPCSVRFGKPGVSASILNTTGAAGVISSITVKTKKYQKIDTNYIPNPAVSGTGFNSINLTNNYGSAQGIYAVVAQNGNAKGLNSFSANYGFANNDYTFANGFDTKANGIYSHAEGFRTIASGEIQHVEGIYNIEDIENKYAHVVGNGYWDDANNVAIHSNAYTLDWNGNGWFSGDVEGNSIIVKSSTEGSNKRFKITVDDSGTISATEIA